MSRIEILDGGKAVGFDCPGCGLMHALPVSGEGRPNWQWNGDAERPTLSPSILASTGHHCSGQEGKDCWCTFEERFGRPPPATCLVCHSFVREGRIEFLGDCTHALAGQTVDLPEVEA